MVERRQSPRLCYMTSARLETSLGTCEGAVRNLSADGIFLETYRQFRSGQRLNIGFRLRHSRQTFDMAGEIRRVTPEGVGIQIIW